MGILHCILPMPALYIVVIHTSELIPLYASFSKNLCTNLSMLKKEAAVCWLLKYLIPFPLLSFSPLTQRKEPRKVKKYARYNPRS